MTPELREYIKAWLQKAEHDLVAAQRLIEIEPMILDGAGFHCQQAAEKSLKAFLIYRGEEIEKTHNIRLLLERVQNLIRSSAKSTLLILMLSLFRHAILI